VSVLDPLSAPGGPTVVFFAGDAELAADVRLAMSRSGLSATRFLSWDPLLYNSNVFALGMGGGPYVARAGAAVADVTYAAHASLPDSKSSFADSYRVRYGESPDEYAAAGYACVEIIAAGLRGAAAHGPTADRVRDLVRGYVVDPSNRFQTVIGTVGFDANGDSLQQFVTFYRFDASAARGEGEWLIVKKQDYGPAP
jgi:ABC-type branched-subunit amino acid transport system substrate-binding protein